MEDGGKVEYTYDSLDRLTAEKRTDPYGQILAWDLYEYDLAGNRTRKTMLDAASNTLMTVNSALSTGNRLASWVVPETNLMARFTVVGHASEPIGTNDRFGALWVSNAAPGGMSVKPGVEGTNFWVHDFTVGMGTQQIVAAIRDMAGSMAYVTNTVIPSVLTNGTYQYSAAGCLTNIAYAGKDVSQTLGLTWDGQYQLTAVSTGAVVESYAYDALGRRVMTAAGGVTNWHVYDGAQVIADLNGTGAVLRTYVWGPGIDNLLAMTTFGQATNTYYAIKDHLGSVLAMTDESGQIVEQYRYDAWGRVLGVFDANNQQLGNSSIGNRYLWQGREYSWAIHAANNGNGLYFFRSRWYDPVTGRWLSNDPIGISGGLNQYVFCANNPVNFRDPFGLCSDDDALHSSGYGTATYLGDRDLATTFMGSPAGIDLAKQLLKNLNSAKWPLQREWGCWLGSRDGEVFAGYIKKSKDLTKISLDFAEFGRLFDNSVDTLPVGHVHIHTSEVPPSPQDAGMGLMNSEVLKLNPAAKDFYVLTPRGKAYQVVPGSGYYYLIKK